MIKIEKVNKIYGSGESQVHALKDIDLELESGKFIALVGKSGSGKSTLMNMIGGLDSVTSGKIDNCGTIISELSSDELADYRNKNIGFVFQSFYLEPSFTVLENVAMPLTIAGVNKKERENRAKEAIIKLGLKDKIKAKAGELSGGQKQRVSIARAIVHNPQLILADEPTGNLDSQNSDEVIALLRQICEAGTTVLLVTHNIDDAKKADIIIKIVDGEIEQIDNIEETVG